MTSSIQFADVSKFFTLYHGESRTIQERFVNLLKPKDQQTSTKEQFWALRDVSFDVEPGQTVGFVGANGSGKSTALKLMARILEPTHGSIAINGRVSALLELGAGFHPDLTGRENIYLNGSLMGLSRREMAACFDDIVDFSELEQFIDMPVKHYSSGMYMRLAFSVAIHVKPEIMLVDEVLAVGDANFQRKCLEHIAKLRRTGVTIVLVSHDLDTVARLCHQVIWLDKGRVRSIGEGRIVVNDYVSWVNEQQQALLDAAEEEHDGSDESAWNDPSIPVKGRVIPGIDVPEAHITAVQVIDPDGQPTTSIKTGEDLVIRIHFKANRRIEYPNFGLGLHRDDGIHVTGPNTQVDNYKIEYIEGPGYVDYTIRSVPLMTGRYYVSASLYDETHTFCYHYVHQVHTFVIQPHSVWDRLGVVRLTAEWSYKLGARTKEARQQSPSSANGVKAHDNEETQPALLTAKSDN